jgi:hypothetical protein
MKHRRTKYGFIFSLLLLSACSSTTFVYNRLDFLLPWYLGDYVELSRPQKRTLDGLLQPFLRWHRMQELPQYLRILQDFDRTLDQPLQPSDLVDMAVEFEDAWARLEDRGLEWLLVFGADLSDAQIDIFGEKLNDQQTEYEEEYLTRDDVEYRQDSYDAMADSFGDYLGRLSNEQKQILRSASEQLLRSDRIWLQERAQWLGKLEVLLLREPGWQQRIRDILRAREQINSLEYQRIYGHNTRAIQAAMVAVLNDRTDKQNQRLRKKIQYIQEDLETLIEQGRKAQAG